MPKPRPSVLKRQREQVRREKNAAKAERRAQRKIELANGTASPESEFEYPDYIVGNTDDDTDTETEAK